MGWCCGELIKSTTMPPKKTKFDPTGDFAVQIVRYLIHKAKEALNLGVSASEGDFSWQSFVAESEALAQSIADKHPGGDSDHFRLARNNFNNQAKKFVDWLASGRGYPKTFATKAGLIESKLGGSEGNVNPGSDDDASEEEEEEDEQPFADTRTRPSRVTPKTKSTKAKAKGSRPVSKVELDDLTRALEEVFINDEDEMQIITVCKNDISVRGFGPVKWQDLLVVQALLPGAALTASIRVEINREDPNQGTITVDQDPNLLVGSRRINKSWKQGNAVLAEQLEAIFDTELEKAAKEGTTPPSSQQEKTFRFPDGLEAQLNPIDPYVIKFRNHPADEGTTLFETKTLKTVARDGKVVPAHLLTAFFFVEKNRHVKNFAGKGLRVDTAASDSDSDGSLTPKSGRKRGRNNNGRASTESGESNYQDASMAS